LHTLDYRFARADEVGAVARLVAHSFPGPDRPLPWWERQLGQPAYGGSAETTLLLGVTAGRVAAACQLHPMRQWIGGAALPMCGVGTVAISPVHRRRHLGGELVTEGLRLARARGDALSALYPFRSNFYRRLGWGQADTAEQFLITPDSLPDAPERAGVELLETAETRVEALALYRRWCRAQTGQLERGPAYWQELCSAASAVAAYRGADGEVEGYALVVYRTDLPPGARFLEVDELVWTTAASRRGLYGWLASLGDQWKRIMLRELPSHRAADWIREPRLPSGSAAMWRLWAPAATLVMGTMTRIVNVELAWSGRRVADGAAFDVVVEVADEQLPDNAGRWRLAFGGGRVAIERATQAEPAIRSDISTISRLFIGALPATAAQQARLLECDRPELLPRIDAALALPEPWTFDRF
jgi:predicted acetyltransferase